MSINNLNDMLVNLSNNLLEKVDYKKVDKVPGYGLAPMKTIQGNPIIIPTNEIASLIDLKIVGNHDQEIIRTDTNNIFDITHISKDKTSSFYYDIDYDYIHLVNNNSNKEFIFNNSLILDESYYIYVYLLDGSITGSVSLNISNLESTYTLDLSSLNTKQPYLKHMITLQSGVYDNNKIIIQENSNINADIRIMISKDNNQYQRYGYRPTPNNPIDISRTKHIDLISYSGEDTLNGYIIPNHDLYITSATTDNFIYFNFYDKEKQEIHKNFLAQDAIYDDTRQAYRIQKDKYHYLKEPTVAFIQVSISSQGSISYFDNLPATKQSYQDMRTIYLNSPFYHWDTIEKNIYTSKWVHNIKSQYFVPTSADRWKNHSQPGIYNEYEIEFPEDENEWTIESASNFCLCNQFSEDYTIKGFGADVDFHDEVEFTSSEDLTFCPTKEEWKQHVDKMPLQIAYQLEEWRYHEEELSQSDSLQLEEFTKPYIWEYQDHAISNPYIILAADNDCQLEFNYVPKIDNSINNQLKDKIVNDITTGGTDKILSAEMGKQLKDSKAEKIHQHEDIEIFTKDVEAIKNQIQFK